MVPKTVGDNIRKYRQEKNLTQKELADLLNVTNKAVSRWECGYGLPDITLLPEIAKLFDVTIDELAGEAKQAAAASEAENAVGDRAENKKPRRRMIVILSVCLAALVIAAVVTACVLTAGKTVPGVDPQPPITRYRFEAEEAEYKGSVYTEADIYASNTYCAAHMARNSLTFTIESDADERGVALAVRMSSCIEMYNERGTFVGTLGVDMEKFDVLNVNNDVVHLTGLLPGSGSGDKSHYLTFYNWSTVTGKVDLVKGQNVFRVVTGNVAFNFDYIELSPTAAKLSWTPVSHV